MFNSEPCNISVAFKKTKERENDDLEARAINAGKPCRVRTADKSPNANCKASKAKSKANSHTKGKVNES